MIKHTDMNFEQYQELFEDILAGKITGPPYDQEKYIDYVRLNQSRQKRWLKTGVLNPELLRILETQGKQDWILITEAWCGDAAHAAPFLYLLSEQVAHIRLEIQLRDQGSEIEHYLTRGTKSIPVLIVRNSEAKDLIVWGPRPKGNEILRQELIGQEVSKEVEKEQLQKWYNQDKGQSFQQELLDLFSQVSGNY